MTPYSTLLAPLIDAVHEAGARILKDWKQPMQIQQKADLSPKTDTDDAAEAILMAAILSVSDIPVIAEEAYSKGRHPDLNGGNTFWLVDALDGTRDFIKGGADYSVNIALIENGQPTFGIIHAPVTGDTWYAITGQGAMHMKDGATRQIHMREPNINALYILGGKRSAAPETLVPFIGPHAVAERGQRSSSIKFCLLAEGRWDVYPRLGETYEWDTASGDIILREAGGSVIDINTRLPLAYAKTGGVPYLNTGFIAGPKHLFERPRS